MVELQERFDVVPLCPHCKGDLHNIAYRELSGMFGKRYVYFCPNCRSVLGVSHRKGFWMG
jgi:uncharacterized protein YbaR (Trm112 family)